MDLLHLLPKTLINIYSVGWFINIYNHSDHQNNYQIQHQQDFLYLYIKLLTKWFINMIPKKLLAANLYRTLKNDILWQGLHSPFKLFTIFQFSCIRCFAIDRDIVLIQNHKTFPVIIISNLFNDHKLCIFIYMSLTQCRYYLSNRRFCITMPFIGAISIVYRVMLSSGISITNT